ncbi:UNVERIFIED_ORG: hypothetical protein ABIB52_003886 [Arthrobacter sp. UYCu721]
METRNVDRKRASSCFGGFRPEWQFFTVPLGFYLTPDDEAEVAAPSGVTRLDVFDREPLRVVMWHGAEAEQSRSGGGRPQNEREA